MGQGPSTNDPQRSALPRGKNEPRYGGATRGEITVVDLRRRTVNLREATVREVAEALDALGSSADPGERLIFAKNLVLAASWKKGLPLPSPTDPPELQLRALVSGSRRPNVEVQVFDSRAGRTRADGPDKDFQHSLELRPPRMIWVLGEESVKVALGPADSLPLVSVRVVSAAVEPWTPRDAKTTPLSTVMAALDAAAAITDPVFFPGEGIARRAPKPRAPRLLDESPDGAPSGDAPSGDAPSGDAPLSALQLRAESLLAAMALVENEGGDQELESDFRPSRAVVLARVLAALGPEPFFGGKPPLDAVKASAWGQMAEGRRMESSRKKVRLARQVRLGLLRDVVGRFFPKVAARIQSDREETELAAQARGIRSDLVMTEWSENQIMDQLSPSERKRATVELKAAQDAWTARIKNDCPHVQLSVRLRYSRAWAQRRAVLEELRVFLDEGGGTRTRGRSRRTTPMNYIRCRRCHQPAMCAHVLAMYEARMATRPAAVDDLVSDRSVLNALAPFIDNDPSRSAQGGQGTIHYCRICGEALGEYISVDASLEVELTLEGERESSRSAVALLRQEGLRAHHRLSFPYEVEPSAYAQRLADGVRGAMITVMINRGVQTDDPLQIVYAAAAATAYVFAQATASPAPLGAPTGYGGVRAKNPVGFATALLRNLAERFRGFEGDDASVTPEFLKRLVLEIRDLASPNAATASFERPRRVEAFVRSLREKDMVYAAARKARVARGRPAKLKVGSRMNPKALAATIDKEIENILGKSLSGFMRGGRAKKKSQLYATVWMPSKPTAIPSPVPVRAPLYEASYSALATHARAGAPAYSVELARASAEAWPRVLPTGAWRPRWTPRPVNNSPQSTPPLFARLPIGSKFPLAAAYDDQGRPHNFDQILYEGPRGETIELGRAVAGSPEGVEARARARFIGVKCSACGLRMTTRGAEGLASELRVVAATAAVRALAAVFDSYRVRCPEGQFHNEGGSGACTKCGRNSAWGDLSERIRREGLVAVPTEARAWAERVAGSPKVAESARASRVAPSSERPVVEPGPAAGSGPVDTTPIVAAAKIAEMAVGQLERLGEEALTPFGRRATDEAAAAEAARKTPEAEETAALAAWRHYVHLATNLSIARFVRRAPRTAIPPSIWDAVVEGEGTLPPEKALEKIPVGELRAARERVLSYPREQRRLFAIASLCTLAVEAAATPVGEAVVKATFRNIADELNLIGADTHTITSVATGSEAGEIAHSGDLAEGPQPESSQSSDVKFDDDQEGVDDEDVSFSYEAIDYDGEND